MADIVKCVSKREIFPECSTSMQRDHVVTDLLIHSLRHTFTLHGHDGCVNTINWNDSGTLLVSGSDDQNMMIWSQSGVLLRKIHTIHSNNIFSVAFLPQARDHLVLSAAGDCQVLLHELDHSGDAEGQTTIQRWECGGRVKKLVTCEMEPRIFWSVSEDGMLRQYDLREDNTVDHDFSNDYGALKSLAVNEVRPEMLALGISNAMVPIYDRRNMKEPMLRLLPAHLSFGGEGRFLATSLAFNQKGDELLVNIGSDNIYIFDVREQNKESSPDVLLALNSFISDDIGQVFPANSKSNGSIEGRSCLDEQFLVEVKQFASAMEYSRAIDKCSEALARYFEKNSLPRHIFSIQFSSLDKDVENKIRSRLHRDSDIVTPFLITRGHCFMERNWEGDQVDAIRDFLSALRIEPRNKLAHQNLVKCLVALKQFQLAKRCFAFYQDLHPEDASMEELIKNFDEGKSKDDHPEWKGQSDSRDYIDRFVGHLNINTDIKEANWFGGRDQYIVAGSDCGSIFIWERSTRKVLRVFKGDNYTVNCVLPHPRRCLIASSGIDNVIRFWEPSSTALKAGTEHDQPEESEVRDITLSRYDLMKRNRRKRTPELVWEQLLNSVGMGLFRVDSTHELNDDEGTGEGDGEEGEGNEDNPHVVRCRQM